MRLTASIIRRAIYPIPTGRKATRIRMAMFQKTTAGPDSHTKWSTGGTFLRACNRSPQALPGSCGASGVFSLDSPATSGSSMAEDIAFLFLSVQGRSDGNNRDGGPNSLAQNYEGNSLLRPASYLLG